MDIIIHDQVLTQYPLQSLQQANTQLLVNPHLLSVDGCPGLFWTPKCLACSHLNMGMGNSTVTRVTFWSFHDTEFNILFTILLFSNPSCGCC